MFILPFTYRNLNLDTCYLTLLHLVHLVESDHPSKHKTCVFKVGPTLYKCYTNIYVYVYWDGMQKTLLVYHISHDSPRANIKAYHRSPNKKELILSPT